MDIIAESKRELLLSKPSIDGVHLVMLIKWHVKSPIDGANHEFATCLYHPGTQGLCWFRCFAHTAYNKAFEDYNTR